MVKREKIENLFRNLADDFSDDLLNMSDEEIFEEAQIHLENPQERAELLRGEISRIILSNRRKSRLIPTQEVLQQETEVKSFHQEIVTWTAEKIKLFLGKKITGETFSLDGSLPDGLLIAFRNKDDLSRDDLINLLEDLYDLGLIDDEKL